METVEFAQVVSRGCGLDVHKKTVVATIDGEGLQRSTREFGTFTSSLTELKDWLLENGITHVAMESTGVYWKPVYHVLEPSGIKVWPSTKNLICLAIRTNIFNSLLFNQLIES
jgi:transposase